MTEIEPQKPNGVSRRTVTKAMAWAVPAIAVAAPIPAFAGASLGTLEFTGDNCKLPGSAANPWKNGAVYIFVVTNTTATAKNICITSVRRSNSLTPNANVTVVPLDGAGACGQSGACFTIPGRIAGQPPVVRRYALVTGEWPSSANGNLIVNFTVGGLPAQPATAPSGDLSPMTPTGNCAIGGSCDIIQSESQCILRATGVPECQPPAPTP